jgi:membrane associated rhomboid family serine protease
MLLQGLGAEPALSASICTLGVIPGELLGTVESGIRVQMGASSYCTIGPEPQPITILTSMFMHGGWFHILGNLWFLFVFGDNVEDAMGPLRFIAFYLLCGAAAVAAQAWSNPTSTIPMVGASGAIGGVMGAYAALYPRVPVHLLVFLGFYIDRIAVPAILMLGYWFLLQVVGGIPALGSTGAGVAFFAHVGGFVAGVALVYLFRDPVRLAAHREHLRLAAQRRRRP